MTGQRLQVDFLIGSELKLILFQPEMTGQRLQVDSKSFPIMKKKLISKKQIMILLKTKKRITSSKKTVLK
jgi:hypothetical protein